MNSKGITSKNGYSEDHVVVASCYGLALVRPDELASYYRGYACFAAPAFVVALLAVAIL